MSNETKTADFFISYTAADRQWAAWIAATLESAGYTTIIQARDFEMGDNFMQKMHEASRGAKRTIAVLSQKYLKSEYAMLEALSALGADPANKDKKLVLVRIGDCMPDGMLTAVSFIDLLGLSERDAKKALLDSIQKQLPPTGGCCERKAKFPGMVLNQLFLLRPPVKDFVPRVAKYEEAKSKIATGHVAIAGLQGMGGAGKTQLARKLAEDLKDNYTDGQLEFDLKGASKDPLSPERVMENILHAFNPEAKLPEDIPSLTALLRQVLDGKKLLLLLDDAADDEQICAVLEAVPASCCVIVTSRHQFTLPSVEIVHLDRMEPGEARAMLKRICARLSDTDADALAKLCDFLPLALRLAASFLNGRTDKKVADYLQDLKDARLKKLDKFRDLSHPDGLQASFALSYDRLKPELQTLFAQLAVFPDHFDRAALEAVWNIGEEDADDAIGELLKYSLLEWLEKEQRYDIHDLLAEFAASLIGDNYDQVAMRYAKYFTKVGSEADALYLKGRENVMKGLALFDRERRHIEHAFAWLNSNVAGGADAGSLVGAEADSTGSRGQRPRLQAARQLIELVNAVVYVGHDLRLHPRTQRIPWLEAQLEAARIAKDRSNEGNALGNLGLAYADLGETRKAIENFEQILKLHREMGDRSGEGKDFGNLGVAYADLGETRKAIGFYEQQLVIAREIGDRRGEGNALGNLGVAYADLGETRKAIGFYEQQLVIVREIGDRRGEGAALGNLGNAYADLGETRKAIGFYEQALAIAQEIGNRSGAARHQWNMALALEKLGEKAEAMTRAEEALRIRTEIEDPNAGKVRAWLAEHKR